MEFIQYVEDWQKAANFVGELPWSVLSLNDKLRKSRQENLKKVPSQEAKTWLETLRGLAEKGRGQILNSLMEPESDLLARLQGNEKGDVLLLLLKRFVGGLGKGIYKVLHTILVKILHLPAMWKFFRSDVFKIGKDFVKSGSLLARKPLKGKSWKAFGFHFLNLLRLPIAMIMMGIGAKFSYQQYQLIQSLGFTEVDLLEVASANVALCYFLFVCFLVPHWFLNTEQAALRLIAKTLKELFPQQMYNKNPEKDALNTEMVVDFKDWHDTRLLTEDISRYSVEVNYRTSKKEILLSWAKLVLGFVSAALQREGYHVKHVYTEKPLRILVSTNNWDDGAWTAILVFNHDKDCFVLSSGFWNKNRRTVSIQREASQCAEDTAAGLVTKVLNFMHGLRKQEPRKINALKPAPMKRGPKK